MKKLSIILDSFSGQTETSLKKHPHYYFLPLKVIADNVEYLDGVDKPKTELLKIVDQAKSVKTSQPSPAAIESLFAKLSKEYENVVYLALGNCLSGTYETASVFANQYPNVHVLNTRIVGRDFMYVGDWMLQNTTDDIETMLAKVQALSDGSQTFIIPKNNDAFIRSGRLGKTMALVLNKAKVVPVIAYEKADKLRKKMIKRTGKNAIKYVIDKLMHTSKKMNQKMRWQICKGLDDSLFKIAWNMLRELSFKAEDIHVELASSLTMTHAGNGAISIGFLREIDGK